MSQKDMLHKIDAVIAAGPYKNNWASLSQHPAPLWHRQGKFGIFIHWGIYAVPAFGNEWYARNMYDPNHREFDHHRQTHGDQRTFGYKDFIPFFQAEKFDAESWTSLFQKAGAKFIMPVAEHHDGFAMYDTDLNSYNATKMGPCRDVLGQLKQAAEKQGLIFCASSHRAEHYFFLNTGKFIASDVSDPAYADFYGPAVDAPAFDSKNMGATTENPFGQSPSKDWLEDWLVHTVELIDRYQPKAIYFDWWIQNVAFKPYLKKLAAYYYNQAEVWGADVTIIYKHDAFAPRCATFDVERGALTDISPTPWQTDTAIGKHSWGYTTNNEFKSSRQLICDLIDIVSKNGTLLLNVGPKADGTITEEETQILLDIGHWLAVNGEGIYNTIPWKRFGEGQVNAEAGAFKDSEEKAYTAEDFRFTYGGGNLYAFQMRPDGCDAHIRCLARQNFRDLPIESVTLLGCEGCLHFRQDENGLHISIPENIQAEKPLCFKICLS